MSFRAGTSSSYKLYKTEHVFSFSQLGSENENSALGNIMTLKKWRFCVCIRDILVTLNLLPIFIFLLLFFPKYCPPQKNPASLLFQFCFCFATHSLYSGLGSPELDSKTLSLKTPHILVTEYREIIELSWNIPPCSSPDGTRSSYPVDHVCKESNTSLP